MRIHQIRNATMIIEYDGIKFLVDPMFAPRGGVNGEGLDEPIIDKPWPLHDLPLPPKDIIKNIDAVILTHLHTDHFDKFAQEILPKGIKIFVQDIFDKFALEKEHFTDIEILDESGTEFNGIKLYKTRCMHGVREDAEFIFLANGMRWEAMGVVFSSEKEPTLYLAGDTVMFEGIKRAIDTYKPKYIVVNAACTELGCMPTIMGIEDIKSLHEYYPEGKLIASHMDCVGHAALSRADLRTSEVKDYIYLPADGEIMLLD